MPQNNMPIVNPSVALREEEDNWAILYNPDTGEYQPWFASAYDQKNPQITNDTGEMSQLTKREFLSTLLS